MEKSLKFFKAYLWEPCLVNILEETDYVVPSSL